MIAPMHRVSEQFIKFSVVGASNTVIDFIVYITLTRGFDWWGQHPIAANTVSFFIATVNSYIWNKRWTFNHPGTNHHVLFVKFFIANGSSFVLYTALFAWLTGLGWYDLLVKVLLIGLVLVWNFVLTKLWVYTTADD
ncbi:MAG: GtrA family protein [Candidatus Kerfeldbacteria bacterium]|nr:GtrA family protein [Candidatus Kerfeldbacteria bacterium]